jgi:hypothetical protein
MEDTTVAEYHIQWQHAALQHRRAIWALIGAGELVEARMEAAKRDLLRLRAEGLVAVAVQDGEQDGEHVAAPDVQMRARVARLQGSLAGAEADYRRISRATYAHLQALRVIQRQLQHGA